MARIGNNQLLLDPVNQGLRDRWNRDTAFTNTVANSVQNVFKGADQMVSGYKKWQDEQEMNKLRDSLSKSDASKMQNIELQKELDALQAVEERRRKYMPGYTGEIGKNNAERMAKINKLQSDIELNKSSILTDDQALLNMNKLASMGDPSYYNAYLQRRAEQNRAADDAYRDNQLKLEEINRQNEALKAADEKREQARLKNLKTKYNEVMAEIKVEASSKQPNLKKLSELAARAASDEFADVYDGNDLEYILKYNDQAAQTVKARGKKHADNNRTGNAIKGME